MQPKAFLKYYGGSDVIFSLTIAGTVEGDNFDEAIKKWKLGDNNFRDLSPKPTKPNLKPRRFIWWR